MKRLIFLFAVLSLVLTSCTTPEQKVEKLMIKLTKKNLVKPNSFECVKTHVDSCFYGDKLTPESVQFAIELSKLYEKYKKIKSECESAQSLSYIYRKSYYESAYSKQQREKYEKELNLATRKRDDVKDDIINLIKEFRESTSDETRYGEFIGFYGVLSYRAETNGGYLLPGENLFFFDTTIENVIAVYGEDDMKDIDPQSLEDIKYEFEKEIAELDK